MKATIILSTIFTVLAKQQVYEVFDKYATWGTARNSCKKWGGQLATITSHKAYGSVKKKVTEFETKQRSTG